MKALRTIFLSLAVLIGLSAQAQAQGGERALTDMANKFERAGAVDVAFTVDAGEGPVQGTAALQGPRFVLDTPVVKVWFDGTTQWTLLKSANEVSITEPTAEELMESNPLAILRNFRTAYRVGSFTDSNGTKRVELIPLNTADTDITRAIVFVGRDGWLASAELRFTGDRVVSATVNRIAPTDAHALSFFRYDSVRDPATAIIDLR